MYLPAQFDAEVLIHRLKVLGSISGAPVNERHEMICLPLHAEMAMCVSEGRPCQAHVGTRIGVRPAEPREMLDIEVTGPMVFCCQSPLSCCLLQWQLRSLGQSPYNSCKRILQIPLSKEQTLRSRATRKRQGNWARHGPCASPGWEVLSSCPTATPAPLNQHLRATVSFCSHKVGLCVSSV